MYVQSGVNFLCNAKIIAAEIFVVPDASAQILLSRDYFYILCTSNFLAISKYIIDHNWVISKVKHCIRKLTKLVSRTCS